MGQAVCLRSTPSRRFLPAAAWGSALSLLVSLPIRYPFSALARSLSALQQAHLCRSPLPPQFSSPSLLSMSRPSKLPALGGGSGARMAPEAAASKLRTAKDRSTSSMGFRCGSEQGDRAASSSAATECW